MKTGQVDLFTKRVRTPPPASEFQVHCLLADTLRLSITPGWIWMHYPAGELRSKATAGRLKRMGVQKGVSDFLLISPKGGQLHALELKAVGRRPTPEQLAFLDEVKRNGGKARWVASFAEAVEVLKDWGAVKVTLI